ncbi:hypothetical protein ACLOJK_035066 [Asimina triloba]
MEEGDTESAETELEGHGKVKEIHYEDFSKYQQKISFPSALEGKSIGKPNVRPQGLNVNPSSGEEDTMKTVQAILENIKIVGNRNYTATGRTGDGGDLAKG